MRNKARKIALDISCRLYSLVMPLYPVALRCQFGPDMADVFEQQIRRECDRHGFAGLVRVWSGIALDVIQSSLPSEINWQCVLVPLLSLAGSFALFVLFFVANGLAKSCIK
jgi:hypothetical protein